MPNEAGGAQRQMERWRLTARTTGGGLPPEPRVAAYRQDHRWRPSLSENGGDLPLERRVAAYRLNNG